MMERHQNQIDALPVSLENSRIGPCLLHRVLGRGGMGVVYLAERDDGVYRQKVAVKVLDRCGDDQDMIRRFERERWILSRLEHPNIVRLFGGGVTETGQPYLIMEYVEGVSLFQYCDQRSLTVDKRLTLFQKICAAVDQAHGDLIIHRDLKPENILVTEQGEPKLLDFGIARLLGEEAFTQIGEAKRLTFQYASPEQIKGEPLTTACDIYALGLLFYELLTGRKGQSVEKSALYGVHEYKPPTKPAMVVTSRTSKSKTIAALRRSSPGSLGRTLSGDLSRIALKALKEEPSRRYETAAQFSQDIERYLNGYPVTATGESITYLTHRWFARHKLLVTALILAVLLPVSFGVSLTIQQKETEFQRAEAQNQANLSNQAIHFMTDLFEESSFTRGAHRPVTAREIVSRGAEKLDRDFQDYPELKAEFMGVLGVVLRNIGDYRQGVSLLEAARDIWIDQKGPNSLELAEVESFIGLGYFLGGRYNDATRVLSHAADVFRESPEHLPDLGKSLVHQALAMVIAGRLSEAEDIALEAIEVNEQLGLCHLNLAQCYNILAMNRLSTGRNHDAIIYARQSTAIYDRLNARRYNDGPYLVLGTALCRTGEFEASEEVLYHNLEARLKAIENHPGANVYHGLAELEDRRNRFKKALYWYDRGRRQALEHKTTNYFTARMTLSHGLLLSRLGQLEEGGRLLEESSNAMLDLFGPQYYQAVQYQTGLGMYHTFGNRPDAAEQAFRKALSEASSLKAAQSQAAGGLARLLLQKGELQEALCYARQAWGLVEGSNQKAYAASALSACYAAVERFEEAEDYAQRSLAYAEGNGYAFHIRMALENLTDLYAAWNRPQKLAFYEKKRQELADQIEQALLED